MKRIVIEVAKWAGAVAIGGMVGAVARPAVDKFLKMDKKSEPETIPSDDIEEEELAEEE